MFQNKQQQHGLDKPEKSIVLYSKTQTVFLEGTSSSSESHKLNLYVTSSVNNFNKYSLFVRITNENDPYYFYFVLLTEEDYNSLKSDQGLPFDFCNFPLELVKLFEECSNDVEMSQFSLVMEEKPSQFYKWNRKKEMFFKIVSTEGVCCLQLKLTPGSNNDVMKLILNRINKLKEIKSINEGSMSQLRVQVSGLSKDLVRINKELECIKKCNLNNVTTEDGGSTTIDNDKLSSNVESNEEIEMLRNTQAEWQSNMETEMIEMEEKYLASITAKEEELIVLRHVNQSLIDEQNCADSLDKERVEQIVSLEEELAKKKEQVDRLEWLYDYYTQ